MKSGDFEVTVFQNAKAEGGGGVDTALVLARDEKVNSPADVPFELVTPANMDGHLQKN